MKLEELNELKKRIEFNLTEPETLVKLVEDSQRKGEKVQKDNKRLRDNSKKIGQQLKDIIFEENTLPKDYEPTKICSVGIDGSFYLVGGVGGMWYAPMSVVRILFDSGIESSPTVDVYAAGIEEIKEQITPNVNSEASLRMLVGESKAIESWGSKNKESLVFIDGPIVDPPSPQSKDYIEDRCKAIKKCLEKSLLIACVKRSRDGFFKKYFENKFGIKEEILKDFPSDQHLFAYLFINYRAEINYKESLFSKCIDVSTCPLFDKYSEQGVNIMTLFFQKNIQSKILRVDIPFLQQTKNDSKFVDDKIKKAIKAVSDWQYPYQYVPLPVQLAHEKCKIREGAAEVLYEEILTKSRSGDVIDQITMMQLR